MAKWDAQNKLLPKEQRRPRPKKPTLGGADFGNDAVKVGGGSAADYNDAARSAFMEEGREPCPNCGRKFLRDRLEVHLRSCKPGGFFAKHSPRKPADMAEADRPASPSRSIETLHSGKVQVTKPALPAPAARPKTSGAPVNPGVKATVSKPTIIAPTAKASVVEIVPTVDVVPGKVVAGKTAAATPAAVSGGTNLAKFCGECGHGFGTAEKFCPSCGVKRMAIN
ncbi:hypothetical protein HDV00_011609 [Rhizophlyctis rosea]|nr:hypothetical protein HDV00_011609 [Rhizophlyctis rosea]